MKVSKNTKEEKTTKKTKQPAVKTKEEPEVKEAPVVKVKKQHKPHKIYFSYATRLIFQITMSLALLIIGTILLNNSLKFEKIEIVEYSEVSELDYKVYLLKNDFYEKPYLDKDMLYVASLIDKIHIDFNYKFNITGNESLDFNYKIIGKLNISNKSGTKSYYDKSYVLLDSKTISMKDANEQVISESIDVDYPYYNSLANNFKNSYGIDTDSTLSVFMVIEKKNGSNSDFELDSSSIANIKIPLSEKSVNIELNSNDINKKSSIVKEKKVSISNMVLLGTSVVSIIIGIIMTLKAIKNILLLRVKKSEYDKYINKLLKEYDRLIAETTTMMSLTDKEVIKISKFTELLDIHDNLQLPIMYYPIIEHQKAYFYISHDKTIYLMTIKSLDTKGYVIEK